MDRIKRPLGYILLTALIALLFFLLDRSLMIDEQTAIEKAQIYCTEENMHLDLVESPRDFKALLLTCTEVKDKTSHFDCDNLASDTKICLVSMDGNWKLWGPPNPDGTNYSTTLTHCDVVIDVVTGNMLDRFWK